MSQTTKKKKAKGPIRFEAIVPTLIIVILIVCYFKFFFDTHLRWGMEFGATQANGAEVNIDYVKTDFLKASMVIANIQVTDKKDPNFNITQIGKISFRALWDGLLRGKIVIPLAAVNDIMVKTKRKRPGRILPVKKSSGSMMKTLQSNALQETRKTLDGNIFGDLTDVLQGTNYKDKLKDMENNLKSSQFISQLEKELKEKEQLWKERIAKLPKDDDFKKIEARAKAIKINGKDPVSVLNAAKEIDALYKEVDAKVKAVKDSKNALNSDLKQYKNIYSEIESYIDKDLNDLQNKLGIPTIDPKDLAMRVFGRQFGVSLQNVERYMRGAREYMPPPKKPGASNKPTPRERAVGINYKFPKTKHYPKFWLQKAEISSKSSPEGFSGDVSGTVINVTDSPKHLGLPTEIKLTGQFPNSQIYNVLLQAIIDHTTDNPKEYGTIQVGSFPLKDITLSDSSDVKYGFKKAEGSSQLTFKLENETVDFNLNNSFNKIDYLVEAKKAKVQEVLTNISNSLGELTLQGSARGSWDSLDLDLSSNLGEKIMAALKQEFNNQVAKYKKELRDAIDKKIGAEKEKLNAKVKDFEQKTGLSLKDKETAIASLKEKLNVEKGKAKNQQKDKLKDAGKKLLKGLKF